ncbi:universal stress protein [Kribbella sp. NPDC048915]|uniref:universal stress protein n=1 Tax=Kribbella sp. NPDC048915 TaxID=3155148 RepID=UPI0033E9D8B7
MQDLSWISAATEEHSPERSGSTARRYVAVPSGIRPSYPSGSDPWTFGPAARGVGPCVGRLAPGCDLPGADAAARRLVGQVCDYLDRHDRAGIERVDCCDATVDFAVRFAAERGAPVRLVHSWDVSRVFTGDAAVDTVEIALRYYGRRLDAILDNCRGRHPDTTFETELRRGHPVSGLIEAADAADAQLLVVGGRAHGRVLSTLLGGTARGILQHATRPVAIVHHRARLD